MILNIILSLVVVFSVSLGEFATLIVFKKDSGFKQYIIQIIFFIVIFNIFTNNILIPDNFINQLLILSFIGFSTTIISKLITGLMFKTFNKIIFKEEPFNKLFVKLAFNLNKVMKKNKIISIFKQSGFDKTFLEHLNKTLK